MTTDADARSRIDRFLGRVEAHLAGRPSEEREELIRDLEAHLHDAVAERGDVEAVLAEMDPPESYGAVKEAPTSAPPAGKPLEVKLAIGLAIAGAGGLFLVAMIDPRRHDPGLAAWLFFWTCELAAAGCGLLSVRLKIAAVPPHARGGIYAGLSLTLLIATLFVFAGAGMLIDLPGGELVPTLFFVAVCGLLASYGFGRASHSPGRLPVRGDLQPLGRVVPALVSAAFALFLAGLPVWIFILISNRSGATRPSKVVDAMPEPILWAGFALLAAAVLYGAAAWLPGGVIQRSLWPLLGHDERRGLRFGLRFAVVCAALGAGCIAVYLFLPAATPA